MLFGIDPDLAFTIHFDHFRLASSLPLVLANTAPERGLLLQSSGNSNLEKTVMLLTVTYLSHAPVVCGPIACGPDDCGPDHWGDPAA